MWRRHVGLRLPLLLLMAFALGPMPLGAQKPAAAEVLLELKGYIVPARQVTVSPKVAGQISELLIEEGQRVKAGDVLARLESAEYELAFRLARAELKLAEARLTKAREAAAKADLAIAQAELEIAAAKSTLAQQRLDHTVIRAPVHGTILTRRAEVGSRVDPRAVQGPASLCDVADLQALEIDLWVSEKDMGKVKKGQPCLIRLEAIPGASYRGQVARIVPIADRAKAAVGVRVRLDLPAGDDRLRPELGAIVQIMAKE
jgi:RND family efflux transporter MFP subunit